MNKEPLISVIVPVYKVEAYLDRCVQSIVDQSYRNLEIILVDDGSPDHCPAMCDAWAEKDSRIRVIHKQNGGLSDARNAGMSIAVGEYVSYIDSDDWIAPEMLERLLCSLEDDDSDIAACSVQMVWEDDTPSRMLTVRENMILEREEAQRALLLEDRLKQPVWYKLYRSELIRQIPFEVGKYHEDVFWSYRAVGKARRVSLIDYVGYYYFQRAGSIMGEGYSLKRLDALEAREKWCDYLAEHFPKLEKEARIRLLNSCIYHGQMALKDLSKADRRKAFAIIERMMRRHPVSRSEYSGLKRSHRMWLDLAAVSLEGTCRIKNILSVGL